MKLNVYSFQKKFCIFLIKFTMFLSMFKIHSCRFLRLFLKFVDDENVLRHGCEVVGFINLNHDLVDKILSVFS